MGTTTPFQKNAQENNMMRHIIFSKEDSQICVKDYLMHRFQEEEDVFPFVDGKILKPPIHWDYVENLATVLKKSSLFAYYAMYTTSEYHTVEVLEIERDRLAFSSKRKPEEIMKNEKLKQILNVVVFEKINPSFDGNAFRSFLKEHGIKSTKNKFIVTDYPHRVSTNNGYLVIQNPFFTKEPIRLQEQNEKIGTLTKEFLARK